MSVITLHRTGVTSHNEISTQQVTTRKTQQIEALITTNLTKRPIGSRLRMRTGGLIVVLLTMLVIGERQIIIVLLLVGGYCGDCQSCWLSKPRELVIILLQMVQIIQLQQSIIEKISQEGISSLIGTSQWCLVLLARYKKVVTRVPVKSVSIKHIHRVAFYE